MSLKSQLAAYLLSAMNAFYPQSNHAFHEQAEVTESRYEAFADDVATVVLNAEVQPLFAGDAGRAKTGLLLISISSFESMFIDDVVTCVRGGDHNHSWGPFQTQREKELTCTSVQDASVVALDMIRESFRVCHGLPETAHLAEYTDGNDFKSTRAFKRSSDRMSRAMNYFNHHPFVLESSDEDVVDAGTGISSTTENSSH